MSSHLSHVFCTYTRLEVSYCNTPTGTPCKVLVQFYQNLSNLILSDEPFSAVIESHVEKYNAPDDNLITVQNHHTGDQQFIVFTQN